ncbi:MAG: DUF1302 family protein [Woeseiaceae bacterium]|nr:DUF1302 family protein [Woeseiaceae bacterium]
MRNRPATVALVLALLAYPPVSTAVEVERASLFARATYGHAAEFDEPVMAELELLPALTLSWSERLSVTASLRLRVDGRDRLMPGEPALDTYSEASRPLALGTAGTLEIRDLFVETVRDNRVIRLGKQQIAWGRLDGIKVLDLLNPRDFREFILADLDESRIGLWSLYVDQALGNWRAELAVIPDPTGHAIPDSGAWFELRAPRFRYGSETGVASPTVTTATPGIEAGNTAVGIRLTRRFGRTGSSIVAYTGVDPEPLGRVVSQSSLPVLERYYERQQAFGFSLERGAGPFVFRTEHVYFPDRRFNIRSDAQLATTRADNYRGALAVDASGPWDLFLNAQFLVDIARDAPADLVRPRRDRILTLFLGRSFDYDRLSAELRWYRSIGDDGSMTQFELGYRFRNGTRLVASLAKFRGQPGGLFGQFEGLGRVALRIEHLF